MANSSDLKSDAEKLEGSSPSSGISNICNGCKHSLENNSHGIDQNDIWEDKNGKLHWDSCTYCKECNPRLRKLLDEPKPDEKNST